MANTITQRTLIGGGSEKVIVRHIHIVSDGTEETDLVVYDNSAFVADVSKGKLMELWMTGDTCNLKLEWDQTADSPVISLDPNNNSSHLDFSSFGGISNPGAAGATGDLVLTTADLDSGDEVTLVLRIHQN